MAAEPENGRLRASMALMTTECSTPHRKRPPCCCLTATYLSETHVPPHGQCLPGACLWWLSTVAGSIVLSAYGDI
jgi:hypothetical protein